MNKGEMFLDQLVKLLLPLEFHSAQLCIPGHTSTA